MAAEHQVVRDETRNLLHKPWIMSVSIATVFVVIYLINQFEDQTELHDQTSAAAFRALSIIPQFVVDGEVYRMLSANLLHSSVWSLLASVITLVLVGIEVEARWGVFRYLASILLVCLGTTIPVLLFEPAVSRWATGNGAAVGLLGAALMVARRAGFRVWLIIVVAIVNLLVYLLLTPESTPWAMVGGFLTGALIAGLLMIAPRNRYRRRVQILLLGGLLLLFISVIAFHVIVR